MATRPHGNKRQKPKPRPRSRPRLFLSPPVSPPLSPLVSPPAALAQCAATAQWRPDAAALEEVLMDYSLPQLVRCATPTLRDAADRGRPLLSLDTPILLMQQHSARYLLGRIVVVDRSGGFTESGDSVVIPEDYEGHFLRLKSRTTKDKSAVRSLQAVASSDTAAFLNLSDVVSYPACRDPRSPSHMIYTKGNVFLVDQPSPASSDVSESDSIYAEVSKGDNIYAEVSKGGNPYFEVSKSGNAYVEASKGGNPYVEVSRGDNTYAKVSKGDNPYFEVSKGGNPYVEVSKGDNAYAKVSKGGNPYVEVSKGGNPYVEVSKGGNPYVEVSKSGNPYFEVSKGGNPYGAVASPTPRGCRPFVSSPVLRCVDERGSAILIPTNQVGEMIEVKKNPSGATKLSMKAGEIMTGEKFPLLVRFVYGKQPLRVASDTRLFTLLDSFQESSLIGCIVEGSHMTMVEMPLMSSLQFQVAVNSEELLGQPALGRALEAWRARCGEFARDIKFKYKFPHRVQSSSARMMKLREDDLPSVTVRTRPAVTETYVYI